MFALRLTRRLIAVVMVASLCQGCALAFIDTEFNNRGGFADSVADRRWMVADTKQMRILRAYVLIGSLMRVARDNFSLAEKEVLIQNSNSAIFTAHEAFECAYAPARTCVYFDDRIVELETSVLRMATTVFTSDENKALFSTLSEKFSDTIPLLKGVNTVSEFLSAVASTGQLAANGAKLIASLFSVGQTAFYYGSRIGALYRDSIELEMVTVIESADRVCEQKEQELLPTDGKIITVACRARDTGQLAWAKGGGNFAEWKLYLSSADVLALEPYMIPSTNSFAQASDLIWRACNQLGYIKIDDPDFRKCTGYRDGIQYLIAYKATQDLIGNRRLVAENELARFSALPVPPPQRLIK